MSTNGNETTHLSTEYTPLLSKPLEGSNSSPPSTTPAPTVDLEKPVVDPEKLMATATEKDLEAQTSTGDATGAFNIGDNTRLGG